jgi:thiol-disulfide isomerase/thioredoxin
MNSPQSSHRPLEVAAVVLAAAFPIIGEAQQASGPLSSLKAAVQEGSNSKSIPERVLKAAELLSLDPSTIKLEGDQWVGCKAGGKDGDVCIPIDRALPEERSLVQTGQLLTAQDYTPEYLNELSELIRTRRDLTVLVIVSVPKYCKWCRVYAEDLQAAEKSYANRRDVKFAVVNFKTYAEATEKMGPERFPFTAVFRPKEGPGPAQDRGEAERQLPFLRNIGEDFEFFSGRKTLEQLRRVVDPPLALPGEAR